RLVAGADTRARIAVEILVEGDAVAPVRVTLHVLVGAEHRPAAVRVAQEDARQAPRVLGWDLPEGQALARAGGTLDQEVVAVVVVELLQRLDQQVVDWEPDR